MRFLADENFNRRIFRQLRYLMRDASLIRAQDVGLMQTPDADILAWAADTGYVVVTHDAATLVADAYRRVAGGLEMPGVILVPWRLPIGDAVEDLLTVIGAGSDTDIRDKVLFLPL